MSGTLIRLTPKDLKDHLDSGTLITLYFDHSVSVLGIKQFFKSTFSLAVDGNRIYIDQQYPNEAVISLNPALIIGLMNLWLDGTHGVEAGFTGRGLRDKRD